MYLPSISQEYVLNEALFRVFDEDKSGTLNFFEWYQATNVKNMSTIEEKLNWIFMVSIKIVKYQLMKSIIFIGF